MDIGLNNSAPSGSMELLLDLIKKGIMPTGIDATTMATLFKEGKVGMIISGPWYFQDFRTAGIDFGFTVIPSINGKPSRPFTGVHGFMVSSFSKNKLLAQAFLNEFIVTKEVMYLLYEKGDRPPAYLPALHKVKNADIKGSTTAPAWVCRAEYSGDEFSLVRLVQRHRGDLEWNTSPQGALNMRSGD